MDLFYRYVILLRKLFITILIFSIVNPSQCFGMKGSSSYSGEEELSTGIVATLRPLNPSHSLPTNVEELTLLDDEHDSQELATNSSDIKMKYVLAFREDMDDSASCSSIAQPISTLIVGIITCFPQVAVALAVGDYYDSKAFGVFLVGLTFVTQSGIAGWITNEFIEDTKHLLKKARQNARGRNLCSLETLRVFKYGIAAFVLGALSSCSDVYKAYKYNTVKELSIITFAFDVVTRTLGLYKAFSTLNFKWSYCKPTSEQDEVKQLGQAYIDLSTRYFLKACKEEGVETTLTQLREKDTAEGIFNYMARASGLEHIDESIFVQSKSFGKGWPRYLAMGISLIFPIGSATFDLVLAYKGYQLIIDNVYVDGSLAIFSVLPTSCLGTYVILKAANSVFDKLYFYKKGILSNDYFSIFRPNTNKLLIGSSIIVGAISSAVGYAIIQDNMADTVLAPVSGLVAGIGVASGLIFGSYTIFNIFKKYGEEIIKRSVRGGTYIFGTLKRLSQVGSLIISSSFEVVSDFVEQINPTVEEEF